MLKTILPFAALALAVLLLFRLSRYALLSGDLQGEIVVSVTALVFLGIGLYLRRIERGAGPRVRGDVPDSETLQRLAITPREYEVLQHVASGLSNREIAARLFLSESTIKTHVSKLLEKLDARRRTEAVERARGLNIL